MKKPYQFAGSGECWAVGVEMAPSRTWNNGWARSRDTLGKAKLSALILALSPQTEMPKPSLLHHVGQGCSQEHTERLLCPADHHVWPRLWVGDILGAQPPAPSAYISLKLL